MANEMFDFSKFNLNNDSNFNKSDRGTYKETSIVVSNPKAYTGKEPVLHNTNVYKDRQVQHKESSDKNISFKTDIGAIADAVSGVINAIGNIITSFNMVSMEREVTKRVKIQADAFIAKEKEETKRFVVSEREQTKRLKASLINDYKKAQLDLIGIVKKLKYEEKVAHRNHQFKLQTVRSLCRELEGAAYTLDSLNEILIDKFKNNEYIEDKILEHINECGRRKIEIMKLIVQVK